MVLQMLNLEQPVLNGAQKAQTQRASFGAGTCLNVDGGKWCKVKKWVGD